MKLQIPRKVLFTVFGVTAAAMTYMYGYKPYQEEKQMIEFEKEAKAFYEQRRKRMEQPAEFKSDAGFK